jgi:hypothetical protein
LASELVLLNDYYLFCGLPFFRSQRFWCVGKLEKVMVTVQGSSLLSSTFPSFPLTHLILGLVL